MLKHLCAKNQIEASVRKIKRGGIASNAVDFWMRDSGLAQIKRSDVVETLGHQQGEVAVTRTDVKR
jgi:hypothetical protein